MLPAWAVYKATLFTFFLEQRAMSFGIALSDRISLAILLEKVIEQYNRVVCGLAVVLLRDELPTSVEPLKSAKSVAANNGRCCLSVLPRTPTIRS